MSHISIENLEVEFPIHIRSHAPGFADTDIRGNSLVYAKNGSVTGVRALRGLSFEAKDGERIGLIGKNGSGKTTLLHVLAGIIGPTGGRVEIHGRATSLININLGIQKEASGHKNIELRGLAAGHSRAAIEERRQEIIDFCELGKFLDMPVETYSAGMRMRLSFAIVTAFEPEILLLDEWLSAGDTAFREKAGERMKNFANQAGILVLASHSRRLLEENCTMGIWLEDGLIKKSGPIMELFDEYEGVKS